MATNVMKYPWRNPFDDVDDDTNLDYSSTASTDGEEQHELEDNYISKTGDFRTGNGVEEGLLVHSENDRFKTETIRLSKERTRNTESEYQEDSAYGSPEEQELNPHEPKRHRSLAKGDLGQSARIKIWDEDQQSRSQKKSRSYKRALSNDEGRRYHTQTLILAGVLVVSLVAVATTLAVMLTKQGDSSNIEILAGSPVRGIRENALDEILARISDPSTLTVEGTPQYKAREWLLYSDSKQLTPGLDTTYARVAQRYALAVFFFSTSGEKEWLSSDWLFGEECEGSSTWMGLSCTDDGHVRSISFDNYGLSGTIPTEIVNFQYLESLVVKNNPKVSGTIPSSIGSLPLLGQLALYKNALTGEIPQEMYDAIRLNYINLQDNHIEGGISLRVKNLKRLEKLILSNNKMSGGLSMHHLGGTKLKYLGLSNNKFSGSIARSITTISDLEYLYLDNNELTGTIPEGINELTELMSINLDSNNLVGSIPTNLGLLTALEYLSIYNNMLTGYLPVELASLTKLRTLNLAANLLQGPLPNLSDLSNLRNLYLFENSLTGLIPDTIGNLDNLEVLFLSSNRFTGPIPPSIVLLGKSLRGVYLSDNNLDGSLPLGLCGLGDLESLFLDENKFTGEIPVCLSAVSNLRQLYVSNNALSGGVPVELEDLMRLNGLGLEGNNLTGKIPQEVCSLAPTPLLDLWADCGSGTPEISCTCCTVCCPGPRCT